MLVCDVSSGHWGSECIYEGRAPGASQEDLPGADSQEKGLQGKWGFVREAV